MQKKNKRTVNTVNLLINISLLITYIIYPAAQAEQENQKPLSFLQISQDNFSYNFYTQVYGITQKPAESSLNPNNIYKIPRYTMAMDIRPDLFFKSERIDASLKPRVQLRTDKWRDGFAKGESDTDTDVFIYEAELSINFNNRVFASYARENLQWGPSSLLSPSNPFNPNNNQNSPSSEMQGMDYAKLIWVPTFNFSASFLANVGAGRLKQFDNEFYKTYALKLDYTGNNYYLSIIPSYQEDNEKFRLGYIGQWNISDVILLYSEGSLFEQDDDFSLLFGGSYTFETGGTLSAEYFHHENGCTLEPVSLCLTALYNDKPIGTFIRKNYLQLSYYEVELLDTFNLMLRWTHGVNDHSNLAVAYLLYDLDDNVQLFSTITGTNGDYNGELNSLLDYSVNFGISYSL